VVEHGEYCSWCAGAGSAIRGVLVLAHGADCSVLVLVQEAQCWCRKNLGATNAT